MVRFERPYMVPFHESLITLILVGQALRHFRRDIAVGADMLSPRRGTAAPS